MSNVQKYIDNNPVIRNVAETKETVWINEHYLPFDLTNSLCQLVVSDDDISNAEMRLQRFAPFIEHCFPETKVTGGLIESPLIKASQMKQALETVYRSKIYGELLLKLDSHLAIAGSVKARGGIYEVLKHAEILAINSGKLTESDNYAILAEPQMKQFFGQYTIQVGSTGNLGISIGTISAMLGFKVKVHMSADAKQWKKDLLRSKGVEVIEYDSDYSQAVAAGRKLSDQDSKSHFIDDEKSVDLFLGYAVAAKRLRKQLTEMDIKVDENHPLIVYIPAGVGGAPGGISYGLKRLFNDNVHCFFVEPTQCPSILLGMATQEFERANVHDFGISGQTEADGLACASPSGFVTRIMFNLLSGIFTVEDQKLYNYLRLLHKSEGVQIEPSACAAFIGPISLNEQGEVGLYCAKHGLTEETLGRATQVVWATGGCLIPKDIRQEYLRKMVE